MHYNIIQGIIKKKLYCHTLLKAHTLLLQSKYIDTHKRIRTLHKLIEFKEPVFAFTET